ncbi:MAG: hypothetical protein IJA86_07735 [Clostridia bacterium]|nr:hypothetical protein [Clostridia bacterium]
MKDYRGKSVLANYYRGIEAVGGKLLFDASGMTFQSHAFNVQIGEIRIEYRDIMKAQVRGSLTGISVFTKDSVEHKFVVYHRTDVIDFLNRMAVYAPESASQTRSPIFNKHSDQMNIQGESYKNISDNRMFAKHNRASTALIISCFCFLASNIHILGSFFLSRLAPDILQNSDSAFILKLIMNYNKYVACASVFLVFASIFAILMAAKTKKATKKQKTLAVLVGLFAAFFNVLSALTMLALLHFGILYY